MHLTAPRTLDWQAPATEARRHAYSKGHEAPSNHELIPLLAYEPRYESWPWRETH